MKDSKYKIKNLIGPENKHLLWKDEQGDDFLILKYGEVYIYSKTLLRLVTWSPQKALWLRKRDMIRHEDGTDDGLYILDIDISYLSLLIDLGRFKRRPNIKGSWIKDKESKLAHKIIPFNPEL